MSDEIIVFGSEQQKNKVRCRKIVYKDFTTNRNFTFITNLFQWKPASIADAYKQRWGIELLFKRLKQNMQFQYFLGDNENAIKIQIYCSLIADLLIKLVSGKVKKKWAFSNLTSIMSNSCWGFQGRGLTAVVSRGEFLKFDFPRTVMISIRIHKGGII